MEVHDKQDAEAQARVVDLGVLALVKGKGRGGNKGTKALGPVAVFTSSMEGVDPPVGEKLEPVADPVSEFIFNDSVPVAVEPAPNRFSAASSRPSWAYDGRREENTMVKYILNIDYLYFGIAICSSSFSDPKNSK